MCLGKGETCAKPVQVMNLIDNELSEPYSIFTYRYAQLATIAALAWLHLPGISLQTDRPLQLEISSLFKSNATVFRYFLHTWPHLCFLAFDGSHCFGTVVAKMEMHRGQMMRGYIAMLVVEKPYRYLGVGMLVAPQAQDAWHICGSGINMFHNYGVEIALGS
jgi:hypothetical protein